MLIYDSAQEVQSKPMTKCWRILLGGILASVATSSWFVPGPATVRHPAIAITAAVAMLGWGWGSIELLRGTTARRWVWIYAALLMFNHVASAFHFGHRWSHTEALEHTRLTAGVAEGLYVNYAFVACWLADALWLVIHAASYDARPKWCNWLLHGFLVFISFNATIIYGTWPAKVLGLLIFGGLATSFAMRPKQSQ
jgi:hypothetical protein